MQSGAMDDDHHETGHLDGVFGRCMRGMGLSSQATGRTGDGWRFWRAIGWSAKRSRTAIARICRKLGSATAAIAFKCLLPIELFDGTEHVIQVRIKNSTEHI